MANLMHRPSQRLLNLKAQLSLLLCALLAFPAVHAAECRAADIQVGPIEFSHGMVSTSLLGSLMNKCSSPTGAEIKFVFYGASDKLLKVVDAWPASTNNIPARATFPYEFTVPMVDGLKRVEAQVLRVRRW